MYISFKRGIYDSAYIKTATIITLSHFFQSSDAVVSTQHGNKTTAMREPLQAKVINVQNLTGFFITVFMQLMKLG